MSIYKNGKLIAGGRQCMPLLSFMWADHILNDASWLRADTFSWQSGSVYQAVYAHLTADITGKTLQSETISGTTIQFYLAEDGHKLVLPDQESNVLAIYNATGVAWYYIIDTANQRFKLPRTKFGFTGIRNGVGGYVEAGLPNITGNITLSSTQLTGDGAFSTWQSGGAQGWDGWNNNGNRGFSFDASRSSSVYGNSETVQPKATEMYLYFYVGQFTQTALENTAGVTTETLNDKLDSDVGNATSTTKEAIVRWGLPDYDNPISISTFNSSHPYTAKKDGLFKAVTGTSVELYVNGVEAYYGGVSSGGQAWAMTAFVSKGDIITTDASSTVRAQLFPLKGVA